MRIVGFDPSLRNFAAASGTLKKGILDVKYIDLCQTDKWQFSNVVGLDDLLCSVKLYKFFQKHIRNKDIVIAEIPTGSQSARSAKSSGICLGILSSLDTLLTVSPDEVKKIVGKTAKKDIIQWAMLKYPRLEWTGHNKDEHCADAIAVIYAGIKKHGLV